MEFEAYKQNMLHFQTSIVRNAERNSEKTTGRGSLV